MWRARQSPGEEDLCRAHSINLSLEPSGHPIPPGKVGDRRNRVLRDVRGTCVVRRRQGARRLSYRASKMAIPGSSLSHEAGTALPCWHGRIKHGGLGGVQGLGRRAWGFPRNLGGTAVSTPNQPGWRPGDQTPGPRAPRSATRGSEPKDASVVLIREGDRAHRDGRQWSQHLIVPKKQGNPPQGSLWREGGVGKALSGNRQSVDRRRERCPTHCGREASQRNFNE